MLSKETRIICTISVTIGRLAGYKFLDENVNCVQIAEEAYEYFKTQKHIEYLELINAHRIALWYALHNYSTPAGKNFLTLYFDESALLDIWTPKEL